MRWPDNLDFGIGLGQARCIKHDTPTNMAVESWEVYHLIDLALVNSHIFGLVSHQEVELRAHFMAEGIGELTVADG